MTIGYIGLGKMGINMVERLLEKKHEVFAFDINEEARKGAEELGAETESSILDLLKRLDPPRLVWIMVPHGEAGSVIQEISTQLKSGDTVVDGGNSPYRESMRRARDLKLKGISFMDAGVSGGPQGARNGACIMVGGERADYEKLEGLFRDLAAEDAYRYVGKHGAGHFVKMAHNGIEYGMMQALAEGFSIMKKSEFNLSLQDVADLYNHRSVIESRLVGWLRDALEEFGEDMEPVSGSVAQSGEGAWTVEAAKELGVPAKVLEEAVNFRFESQNNPSYAGKLLSAIRNQFGGHSV